jgi:hypothetical protein
LQRGLARVEVQRRPDPFSTGDMWQQSWAFVL